MSRESWILPDWPAPPNVRAVSTTRVGGVSSPPYHGLNLADHVGDSPMAVQANRQWLSETLKLPAEPNWLHQIHGVRVIPADATDAKPEADGSFAVRPGVVCAVLTADCLPLLLCDRAGSRVAVAHAGWRGLFAGVIEATVDSLEVRASELMAWLGPAIGPKAFEVGDEVRSRFTDQAEVAQRAFRPSASGRWLADIYELACQRLKSRGITAIYGGNLCTLSDPKRFFSYRRDGTTGRMASLIWLTSGQPMP